MHAHVSTGTHDVGHEGYLRVEVDGHDEEVRLEEALDPDVIGAARLRLRSDRLPTGLAFTQTLYH